MSKKQKKVEEMRKKKQKIQPIQNIDNKKIKKFALYIICIITSIYVCYTIFLLIKQPTDTFTIENGKLYEEETDIGYIIRDEKVVKGENYENGMEKIKIEGEKVAKNESVFRYYSKNENTLKEKISELDTKIQEAMENETNLYSSDIKLIENQIDEKVAQIREITDVSKLDEYKKEIDELVTKKSKIAGDLSPSGSYLNKLIKERSNYESELNSGAEYIKSPKSGIVSYKVDGFEDKITPNNLSELNKKYLESLNLKTGKIIATSEECGKIIDNFNCYIATISNSDEAKNAKVNDKIKIRKASNDEIDATITNINPQEDGSVLLIVSFNKQIEELTNYRKISFDLIWWEYEGLKVPNQSILEENGLNYVIRNRAGYLSKLLVKVSKQNESYSIITSYTTDELRELGFTDNQINEYKKISIYDEILLNPNTSRVK